MRKNGRRTLGDDKKLLQYRAVGVEESKASTVEIADNHIYFYSDVNSDECLKMMRAVRETDLQLRSQQVARGIEDTAQTPIWIHIHSYGGDLFSGFSIADQLKLIKSPIYTVVEGVCASAATLIALSGNKRYILPNSFMLIHQLSTMAWGTHEQFKDEMNLQENAMQRLVRFYGAHSKMSEGELRDLLKRDYWMDSETCLKNGFVDEILGA
jgi:ATP-dependent protease ClpP protease subunit